MGHAGMSELELFASASNGTFGREYEQDAIELGHRPASVLCFYAVIEAWAREDAQGGTEA